MPTTPLIGPRTDTTTRVYANGVTVTRHRRRIGNDTWVFDLAVHPDDTRLINAHRHGGGPWPAHSISHDPR